MTRSRTLRVARRQRGFLVIAAVFLLVVLGGLVGYLMTVSTTSQAASAADFNSGRAYQAAHAGVEWGAYQILRAPGGGAFKPACDAGSATKNLTFASTLADYTATVTCTSVALTEGASSIRAYSLVVNACNQPSGGACPNSAATAATYVERQVTLSLAK